ncbi:Uncharacterised protein [Segatella copri]|nr:Uncharacterised protein [Segatella copri]
MDFAQTVGVIIITERTSRSVFIWSPTMEISLSTSTLLPAKTLWTILRHLTGTMQEHEVFIRLGIRLARKVILRLSLSDGTLVFLRHKLNHAMLLTCPKLAARKSAAEDG